MIPKTEIIIKEFDNDPVYSVSTSSTFGKNKQQTANSLYQRLFNKSIKQPHFKEKTSHCRMGHESSEKAFVSNGDISNLNELHEQVKNEHSILFEKIKMKFASQIMKFNLLVSGMRKHDQKSWEFRAVPCSQRSSQMCDVFIAEKDAYRDITLNSIYILNFYSPNENGEQSKEYYVRLLPANENKKNMHAGYKLIEINNILMAKMGISKYCRVTLTCKKTVLNFFERLEIIPSRAICKAEQKLILEDFKRMIVNCCNFKPILINQNQLFELLDDKILITVKIYPETFRYCLCDSEVLRENKIFISEQMTDLEQLVTVSDRLIPLEGYSCEKSMNLIPIDEFSMIVDDIVENILLRNGSSGENNVSKRNNYLIIGRMNK